MKRTHNGDLKIFIYKCKKSDMTLGRNQLLMRNNLETTQIANFDDLKKNLNMIGFPLYLMDLFPAKLKTFERIDKSGTTKLAQCKVCSFILLKADLGWTGFR